MFLTEFFTILTILVALVFGYKYRDPFIKWLKTKPDHDVKKSIVEDMETLIYYGVDDSIERIVKSERVIAEKKAMLSKQLKEMKNKVYEEGKLNKGVIQLRPSWLVGGID